MATSNLFAVPSRLEITHYTPSSIRFIVGAAIMTIPIVRSNHMLARCTVSAKISNTRMLTMYQVRVMPEMTGPHDEEIMRRIEAVVRISRLLMRKP